MLAAILAASAVALRAGRVRGDARPRLFAFVPVLVRSRALQEALDAGLPGIAVTVYGRFADFAAGVDRMEPEAALGPAAALRAAGAEPVIHGVAQGATVEPQVLLSKRTISRQALERSTIGAVDIVGRHRLPRLVAEQLGLDDPPPIRRVVKVSDLLPLLQLDLAEAILLPERFVGDFHKMSQIEFKSLRLESARLERVAVAFPRLGGETRVETAVRHMPSDTKRLLGVEGWQ